MAIEMQPSRKPSDEILEDRWHGAIDGHDQYTDLAFKLSDTLVEVVRQVGRCAQEEIEASRIIDDVLDAIRETVLAKVVEYRLDRI